MDSHLFFSGIDLSKLVLFPEYQEWLVSWLTEVTNDIENGDVAISMCLQGLLVEQLLYGECRTDWQGAKSEYLIHERRTPLAYSKGFADRLFRFAGQYLQTPIHAVHAHWWIDCALQADPDHDFYARLVEAYIQDSGWIYNPAVSPTGIRTRMKSEYMMSMAMGLAILSCAGRLTQHKDRVAATLSSQGLTPYLSSEYFRQVALNLICLPQLKPVGLEGVINACAAKIGYCDFSVGSKVDDYMGTIKRTARDEAVFSPLSSTHAWYLGQGTDVEEGVARRLKELKEHLLGSPYDIPAFRMRDVDIPFGTDVTPLELVAASYIIQRS